MKTRGSKMATTPEGQRLFVPALAPFYARVTDLSWLLVRLTAGLMLLPHGIPKVFSQGIAGFAAAGLARRGIEPSLPLAYWIAFLETIGGLCIALGLFTRFFAAAVAIEMAVIAYHSAAKGFGWINGGYEYPLMWGLIMFAIALRGGGPYSLDRRIGREL
jgi:putative oxidoreductase